MALFEEMVCFQIKPDVVSCTALITALGADGQWTHAQAVVDWMMRSGVSFPTTTPISTLRVCLYWPACRLQTPKTSSFGLQPVVVGCILP